MQKLLVENITECTNEQCPHLVVESLDMTSLVISMVCLYLMVAN
ncbi:hypothetical protein OK016_19705 [Vibrio chagasii]|nr:hypothetical protein [Vibrio chagasii]